MNDEKEEKKVGKIYLWVIGILVLLLIFTIYVKYIDDGGENTEKSEICTKQGYENYDVKENLDGIEIEWCCISNCGGISCTPFEIAKVEKMDRNKLGCGGPGPIIEETTELDIELNSIEILDIPFDDLEDIDLEDLEL